MILTIKSDQPNARLALYDNKNLIDEFNWEANRELSNTILIKIEQILSKNKVHLSNLSAVVVFKGPGSFTGLRIGMAVANTLAYSLNIPVVASEGENWELTAIKNIKTDVYKTSVSPTYGSPVNITKPKH